MGNNIQAIFGPRSETIKGQMKDIIDGKRPRKVEASPEVGVEKANRGCRPETFTDG
ncbi:hypothetical protein RCO48_29385 [Peribacillus frigoritolerans]|nr:hypothetical protein [Peribacillus frigoritolerans]